MNCSSIPGPAFAPRIGTAAGTVPAVLAPPPQRSETADPAADLDLSLSPWVPAGLPQLPGAEDLVAPLVSPLGLLALLQVLLLVVLPLQLASQEARIFPLPLASVQVLPRRKLEQVQQRLPSAAEAAAAAAGVAARAAEAGLSVDE
eukprot:CAMPEP_0178374248 /NCGR_PEP_ID=MMETSP0689_2-20121128/2279_1 /TAXON_ID=160604 /ORGANISM="Amphidinium massartii, Strain CS-259" /LENGTH=145 /DNA_ID=CAMNT_0019994213 /DNA_START=518 /DNA_END=955 /DNA_ORIENTATION=+